MSEEHLSPQQQQYKDAKDKNPSRLVFFRIGDYYECLHEDARITANALDIALSTRIVARGQRVHVAQIPCHAAQGYFDKLVAKGLYCTVYEYIGESYGGRKYGDPAD